MKLAALMAERPGRSATAHWDTAFGDLDIAGLSADSRQVARGFLFAALPGARFDGRRFIPNALGAGAGAILSTMDVTRDVLDGARRGADHRSAAAPAACLDGGTGSSTRSLRPRLP